MVMSDDPFDDPAIHAAAHGVAQTSGDSSISSFLFFFVGMPMMLWTGFTFWSEIKKEEQRREQDLKATSQASTAHATTTDNAAATPLAEEVQENKEETEEKEERPPTPLHPEIQYAQSVTIEPHKPLAEVGPKDAFVIENTPAGLIAMGYDFAQKRWIYWANNTPHFRVLDTLARVYANTHNRQDLYIPPAVADAANAQAEKKAEGAEEQEGESLEKIAEDKKASLFIEPTPVGAAAKPKPDKMHIANCFKRQGMLSELRFIPEGPREEAKKTSYADFLKQQKEKN